MGQLEDYLGAEGPRSVTPVNVTRTAPDDGLHTPNPQRQVERDSEDEDADK